MSKRALITGITGQDGSYLAELLLEKGYEVHGIVRRSTYTGKNIRQIKDRVKLHLASIDNHLSVYKVIDLVQPDECYHLAAAGFVSYSLDDELSAFANGFSGTHCLLGAIKEIVPKCRFYYAGSSEMFGSVSSSPQNELTAFNPRSLYGIAKLSSYHLLRNYRDRFGIFSCAGILFNHESPRRGHEYVTRKITSTAAKIKLGLEKKLVLGNLDAQRDWGYAPEYVEAMWRMLQQDQCEDFVISTGKLHSVRYFVQKAFEQVGLDYQDYIQFDERFFRESDKVPLCGDSSKALKKLGWSSKTPLDQIIAEMVKSELEHAHSL